MPAHKLDNLLVPTSAGVSNKLCPQWPGTVSWVLRDSSDAHHPLSRVIQLGICHPRKKERNLRSLSENPGQALTFKCVKNDKITHDCDCAPQYAYFKNNEVTCAHKSIFTSRSTLVTHQSIQSEYIY